MRTRALFKLLGPLAIGALLIAPQIPATAQIASAGARLAEEEPAVIGLAWYWRDQIEQKITNPADGSDVTVLSFTNPYCPGQSPAGSPPEQTCGNGRLPVEVREGDYETPNKKSAIAFDLSLIPIGSAVSSFKVTFLEASDRQARAVNIDGHEVKACLVTEVFGDGEARVYKEAPKASCSGDVPVAKRKANVRKNPDGTEETFHTWTFDLTSFAKEWVAKGSFFSAVMLQPKKPKDVTPQDNSWLVVFSGPEVKNGIRSSITYTPAKVAPPTTTPPPTDTGTDGTTGTTSGTDFGSSTTTVGTDTGTGTIGTDTGTGSEAPANEEAAPPTDLSDQAAPAADKKAPGMPGYVWLLLLAGMIAFSLVRSVVIESATGIRPDGVLAQIQRINSERRGGAEVLPGGDQRSVFAPVANVFKGIGDSIASAAKKLSFPRRG